MEHRGSLIHVYSAAGAELGVRAGDVLYANGLTPRSLAPASSLEAIREQTRDVLQQMQALLSAHGGTVDNLARVTGYVNDAGTEREAVYDVWDALFPRPDDKPAFKILDAALPEGTLFRLDLLARLGHTRTRIDIDNVDARDPCVRIGDWLLTSRLHGTSPETGETVPGGLEPEARQALTNGLRLVELAGGTKADVTQVCGFGVDLTYVHTLRRIVDETFAGQKCRPAFQAVRTFVRPVLAVMVEVTAVIGSGGL